MEEEPRPKSSWMRPWHWKSSEALAVAVAFGLFYVLSFLATWLIGLYLNEPQTYQVLRTAYFPIVFFIERFIIR